MTVRQARQTIINVSRALAAMKTDERRYPLDRENITEAERLLDLARAKLFECEEQD